MRKSGGHLPEKARDEFSLGYVLGYCDGTLQFMGIEDEHQKRAVMEAVMGELFGRQEGQIYADRAISSVARAVPEVLRGVQVGGDDAYKLLYEKRDRALGWMFYVNGLRE
jgi:hypothetical protein